AQGGGAGARRGAQGEHGRGRPGRPEGAAERRRVERRGGDADRRAGGRGGAAVVGDPHADLVGAGPREGGGGDRAGGCVGLVGAVAVEVPAVVGDVAVGVARGGGVERDRMAGDGVCRRRRQARRRRPVGDRQRVGRDGRGPLVV